MKLLLVYPASQSNVFFSPWAEQMRSQGINISICTNTSLVPRSPFPTQVPVFHTDFPRGSNPLQHVVAAQALVKLVKRLKPDVIHAHFSASIFTTALAKRLNGPSTIGTFHGISYPILKGTHGFVIGAMEKWAAKRLKHVIVLNRHDRQVLERDVPELDLHMAGPYGLGCDLIRFDSGRFRTSDRQQLRQNLGISPTAPVAIFVGRFVHFKGFDCTIKAFRDVLQESPEARLLCVGDFDPVHKTGLDEENLRWAKSSPSIVWAGWQEDVSPFLYASDVMVFPSKREGMPVCLMEAQAMGLPSITTETRGCEDIVQNGLTGILVNPDDVKALSAAMLRLFECREEREAMSQAALEGRQRFDPLIGIREHLGIYRQILG